jgi:hypothetical protein
MDTSGKKVNVYLIFWFIHTVYLRHLTPLKGVY